MSEAKALFERFISPVARAVALANVVGKHAEGIRAGRIPFPVLEHQEVKTLQRWHHLRLEACINAVKFGDGSLFALADARNQDEVLVELLERKSHLAFPQPSGSVMAQSLQGMWQAYVYLSDAGTKVADVATDRFRLQGHSITASLEARALEAQRARDRSVSLKGRETIGIPTIFEIFFEDINTKSKSIALSVLLGPDHEVGASLFREEINKARGEAWGREVQLYLDMIDAATDPDSAILLAGNLSAAEYF